MLLVALLIPLMILLAKWHLSKKTIYWKGLYKELSSKVFPEVRNSRKLYTSKEDIGRNKALATSMPMELNGKKFNTPTRRLFPKRRSMILLSPREQILNMTFHHKTTSSRARTSFERRLTYLRKNPKPWSSGFPSPPLALVHQTLPQLQGSPSSWCGSLRRRTREILEGWLRKMKFTLIHFGNNYMESTPTSCINSRSHRFPQR